MMCCSLLTMSDTAFPVSGGGRGQATDKALFLQMYRPLSIAPTGHHLLAARGRGGAGGALFLLLTFDYNNNDDFDNDG